MPTLLLLALACAPADPGLDSGSLDAGVVDAATGIDAARVGWHVDFAEDGLSRGDAGWSVTTAEGRIVTVEGGYLGLYSATLVPCESSASLGDAALGVLGGLLLGRAAHAGHGDVTNPIAASVPMATSLSPVQLPTTRTRSAGSSLMSDTSRAVGTNSTASSSV